MEKLNKFEKYFSRFVAIIVGILGLALLVLSFLYEKWSEIKDNKIALILLLVFYFISILVYTLWISDDSGFKWRFKDISLCSFIINCLFYPGVAMIVLLAVSAHTGWSQLSVIIRVLSLIIHIIIIAIWTGTKLHHHTEIKESELMKIDLISTFRVLPRTIVWIMYDISSISWEFMLFMSEFLAIQIAIKYILLKRKERIGE